MAQQTVETLAALYETDETAWLERTAELLRAGRLSEVDTQNLAEYLTDMAKRDRQEVFSRLVVVLAHLLKWQFQPDRRSRSWLLTILKQRQELEGLAGLGVLRQHAGTVLPDAYQYAVERVVVETGLSPKDFPATCPDSLDQLLSRDLLVDEI